MNNERYLFFLLDLHRYQLDESDRVYSRSIGLLTPGAALLAGFLVLGRKAITPDEAQALVLVPSALGAIFDIVAIAFVCAAIAPRDYRYLPESTKLSEWRDAVRDHISNNATGSETKHTDVEDGVSRVIYTELIKMVSEETDHNFATNRKRKKWLHRAQTGLTLSFFVLVASGMISFGQDIYERNQMTTEGQGQQPGSDDQSQPPPPPPEQTIQKDRGMPPPPQDRFIKESDEKPSSSND